MYLDIISVNIWNIVVSLCNLLILFLVIKKFLYKPVQNVLAKRKAAVDEYYSAAAEAEKNALDTKNEYEAKLSSAKEEADDIISKAKNNAERRGDEIVAQAKDKAESIIRQAQTDADLERKKADEDIRREIVDVSSALAEKMIGREINEDDHRKLIDDFIDGIGDGDDTNK